MKNNSRLTKDQKDLLLDTTLIISMAYDEFHSLYKPIIKQNYDLYLENFVLSSHDIQIMAKYLDETIISDCPLRNYLIEFFSYKYILSLIDKNNTDLKKIIKKVFKDTNIPISSSQNIILIAFRIVMEINLRIILDKLCETCYNMFLPKQYDNELLNVLLEKILQDSEYFLLHSDPSRSGSLLFKILKNNNWSSVGDRVYMEYSIDRMGHHDETN